MMELTSLYTYKQNALYTSVDFRFKLRCFESDMNKNISDVAKMLHRNVNNRQERIASRKKYIQDLNWEIAKAIKA